MGALSRPYQVDRRPKIGVDSCFVCLRILRRRTNVRVRERVRQRTCKELCQDRLQDRTYVYRCQESSKYWPLLQVASVGSAFFRWWNVVNARSNAMGDEINRDRAKKRRKIARGVVTAPELPVRTHNHWYSTYVFTVSTFVRVLFSMISRHVDFYCSRLYFVRMLKSP